MLSKMKAMLVAAWNVPGVSAAVETQAEAKAVKLAARAGITGLTGSSVALAVLVLEAVIKNI